MNDWEPEQPVVGQRAFEIKMVQYSGEDLAESTGFSQAFERSKQMPHFNAVLSSWEDAGANLQYTKISIARLFSSELRRRLAKNNDEAGVRLFDALHPVSRGRPKADPDADFDLLTAWLHCGIWMLSHDDRALCMQFLFRHKRPLGTDALRKRCKRLGLLGCNDFPQTYHQAPLSCFERDNDKVVFKVAPFWESYFA